MKLFLLCSILVAFSTNAQSNRFSELSVPEEFICDNKTEVQIQTIEMLGKFGSISTVEPSLPSNYNWTADVRKYEAINRTTSHRIQDSNGRDIPVDLNQQNTSRLINRYMR